jgi:hypothetical protein
MEAVAAPSIARTNEILDGVGGRVWW